ncbi:hypothetical protein GCM10022247_37400 [Allokutzneria multivorans]|uniref:Uncharacterized protein n=1 Tax=Allokutzneria multivorans TaxID=1142134 RepID=A0ABP7SGT8_9PSEU
MASVKYAPQVSTARARFMRVTVRGASALVNSPDVQERERRGENQLPQRFSGVHQQRRLQQSDLAGWLCDYDRAS